VYLSPRRGLASPGITLIDLQEPRSGDVANICQSYLTHTAVTNSFEAEFKALLTSHGIEFEEKYLWS
jgi:hypothetical protein